MRASWCPRAIAHGSSGCARYALRPPIAHDRIQWTADGDVLLALRHRWSDGTTHLHPTAHTPRGGGPGLRFHPLELLERLASLTPRPRINLVLYYGVLAAARRVAVAPAGAGGWRAIADGGRGDTGTVFSGLPVARPRAAGIELPVGRVDAAELSGRGWAADESGTQR